MISLGLSLLLAANIIATPAYAEEEITTHQLVEMAIQRWFDPSEQDTAECIVEAESEDDPFARGSAGEVGVAQAHPIHAWVYPDLWPLMLDGDIEAQVAVMHNQWEGSGWRPWIAQKGVCW